MKSWLVVRWSCPHETLPAVSVLGLWVLWLASLARHLRPPLARGQVAPFGWVRPQGLCPFGVSPFRWFWGGWQVARQSSWCLGLAQLPRRVNGWRFASAFWALLPLWRGRAVRWAFRLCPQAGFARWFTGRQACARLAGWLWSFSACPLVLWSGGRVEHRLSLPAGKQAGVVRAVVVPCGVGCTAQHRLHADGRGHSPRPRGFCPESGFALWVFPAKSPARR
jgi:hypothetical protein